MRVPSPAEEAVRDLVRARDAMLADRKPAQQRLTAVLMRHRRSGGAHVLDGGAPGVDRRAAVRQPRWPRRRYYRATLAVREAELASLEAELIPWRPASRWPGRGPAGCYRGIAELGG